VTPEALAALCAVSMPEERLTADELEWICFGDGDEVVGDEHGAAVMTVKRFGEHVAAWLVLVAVEPGHQGRGHGKELVAEVADRARAHGCADLHLAAAVPRYVWPGVDLMHTQAAAFCEGLGFADGLLGINMAIPTSFRRPPPPGYVVERETTDGVLELARRAFPHWVDEARRGIDLGTTFAARTADGETVGFASHSVCRAGWIGPMATDPRLQHSGIGSATLAALCEDIAARHGLAAGEISWVSNLGFYGKCEATVSRVFRGGRLRL